MHKIIADQQEALKAFRHEFHNLNSKYSEFTDEDTGDKIAKYWLMAMWEIDEKLRELHKLYC